MERYADLREIVFDQAIGEFFELMVDPFGNYLAQVLIEMATDDQLKLIVLSIKTRGSAYELCKHQYGTRSAQ